jgi:hypothetical protein
MTRVYGWKKEAPSDRDKLASVLLSAAPAPPKAASLRSRWGGRIYQSKNDCTANAAATLLQLALTPEGGAVAPLPSRDFIYYESGVPTGDQGNDVGRYNRDVCGAISQLGWPDEAAWPYDSWPKHPGGAAHRSAFDRRASSRVAYHRITDVTGDSRRYEMEQAIAHGYGFKFGTLVTPAFEYQDGKTPLPMAGMNDAILGGHSLAGIEYDDFGVRGPNWWEDFGLEGWWFLSWAWMTSSYVSDCWIYEIKPGAVS